MTESIADLAGISREKPLFAFLFAMLLFSLAGIPPLAGFFAKFYLFRAAMENPQLYWLVVLGVLNSVISVYYYLRITVALYMREPDGEPVAMSINLPAVLALLITAAATLYFGMQAQGLWLAAQRSVLGLL